MCVYICLYRCMYIKPRPSSSARGTRRTGASHPALANAGRAIGVCGSRRRSPRTGGHEGPGPPGEICPLGLRVQYMHIYMCAYTSVCGGVCVHVRRCVVCACVRLQGRKHQFIPSVLSMLHKSGLVTGHTLFFFKKEHRRYSKIATVQKSVCVCVFI